MTAAAFAPPLPLTTWVNGMGAWVTMGVGWPLWKPLALIAFGVTGFAFVMPDPVSLFTSGAVVGGAVGVAYGAFRVAYLAKANKAEAEAIEVIALARAKAIKIVEDAKRGSLAEEVEALKATVARNEAEIAVTKGRADHFAEMLATAALSSLQNRGWATKPGGDQGADSENPDR